MESKGLFDDEGGFFHYRWRNKWFLIGDLILCFVVANLFLLIILGVEIWGNISTVSDIILIPIQWIVYWIGMRKNGKELKNKIKKLEDQLKEDIKLIKKRRLKNGKPRNKTY